MLTEKETETGQILDPWVRELAGNPEEPSVKKDKRFRINYLLIVHNLPFILYLALLALLYIANGHYTDKNIREINSTTHQIQDLRWQYLNIKSDLMFKSKMSEVAKSVAPFGLKELEAPPAVLVVGDPGHPVKK
ncbi:MAG TPA: FtsL-like putative cell division protein [Chitinophagaceae bacterium]|nr:FtsL-like putative cell division protein [Chitinophagaceae bacterium]